MAEHGDVTVAGPLPLPLSQPSATLAAVKDIAKEQAQRGRTTP